MSDNPQQTPPFQGPIGGYGGQQQYPPQAGAPGQPNQHPLANYQFSSDELRVLRECNSESFFQRCIPISASLGFGTYFAVKNGILSPNSRFGYVPKVVVSVIIGYFLGKVSYQKKCAEKMMQLPNSKLGEILRQKRQGTFNPLSPQAPGFGLTPFSGPQEEVYDDSHLRNEKRSSALDLDTERPSYGGLDDSQRFVDSQPDVNLPLEPPKNTTTYEELRKANRDEYYKRMSTNAPQIQNAPTIVRVKEPEQRNQETDLNKPKNKYGDVWSQ